MISPEEELIPPGDTALLRPDGDSEGRQKVLGNEEPSSPTLEGGALHGQEHGDTGTCCCLRCICGTLLPPKAIYLSLSDLTDSSGEGRRGEGNHYLLKVQCIPDSVVEYIVQPLLVVVAPITVLGGFHFPVISAA